MPFIRIRESPLLPGTTPVGLFYREQGRGVPLVFLHGGWGYNVYPFDRQIKTFGGRFRIVIPDRSGYGRSSRLNDFPVDFHRRAAVEMLNFLEALAIEPCVLWGHSDGAVIAAMMGLARPTRFLGLILEAFHFYRAKRRSHEFFRTMARDPDRFGERICRTLAREHGEDYWRTLLRNGGCAWLKIAAGCGRPEADLYGGRLSHLTAPTCFVHGSQDPRTEPGELAAAREQLPHAAMHVLAGVGHSPHTHKAAASECNRLVAAFLRTVVEARPPL